MSKKYQKSPIIEAICEFRFDKTTNWDMALPGLIYKEVEAEFPKRKPVKHFEINLTAGEDLIERRYNQFERVNFFSKDDKAFIQIGKDHVSIHQFEPYESWAKFLPKIKTGFDSYRSVVKPDNPIRIGLRYINLIHISELTFDIKKYFDIYPHFSKNFPEDFTFFSIKVDFPYEEKGDLLQLRLKSARSRKENHSAILLDLDYGTTQPKNVVLEQVLNWLQQAHENVYRIFEASITDNTRSLFGEE